MWRHWLAELGDGHTIVRYDERGCGLSDRELGELSVETWVSDLETVVDAAGVGRFTLLGVSQGAAIALVYAARHPERVNRLVLYGGYARGRMWRGDEARAHAQAMASAIRAGWTDASPTFRHLFSMLFLPQGTEQQMAWYDELQRRSTSAESAVRLYAARDEIDVVDVAPRVTTPTLVAHARGDRVVPVEEGRLLAARIPGGPVRPVGVGESHPALRRAGLECVRGPVSSLCRVSAGTSRAGRAEPARARGPRARGCRPHQRRDRHAPVPERPDGRATHLQRLSEAARVRQGGTGGRRRAVLRVATCWPSRDARRVA